MGHRRLGQRRIGRWIVACASRVVAYGRPSVCNWRGLVRSLRTLTGLPTMEQTLPSPSRRSRSCWTPAAGRSMRSMRGGRSCIAIAALAAWLGLEAGRIVGRSVEYHSEPAAESRTHETLPPPPLTDLCPPPQALAGNADRGHDRLRRPRWSTRASPGGIRAARGEPATRAERRAGAAWRRPTCRRRNWPRNFRTSRRPTNCTARSAAFAAARRPSTRIESLLGESAGMRKVRAQVAAAAASQANVLVRGRRGTGREHMSPGRSTTRPRRRPESSCRSIAQWRRKNRCGGRSNRCPRPARSEAAQHARCCSNLERLPAPLQSQLLPVAGRPASLDDALDRDNRRRTARRTS